MLRFALRRFYFGLIGVLLFTALVSAALRFDLHYKTICYLPQNCDFGCNLDPCPRLLARDGTFYTVWQGGWPSRDYWPLAVVLLASAAAVDLVGMRRSKWREASVR